MLQAMLASMSSIEAQQARLDVIGNNLANINTAGFKGSDVSFEDMMSQQIRGGIAPIQYGTGVMVGATDSDNGQGTLTATNQPSDLALQGPGYFVVSDGTGLHYTRDGSFGIDSSGNLIQTSTGEKVAGWTADSNGNISTSSGISAASTIVMPMGTMTSVKATSNAALAGNLSSTAKSTDTWTTNVRVFDALGGAHTIAVNFTGHTSPPATGAPKGAVSSWTWNATQGTTSVGSSSSTGNQPLYFDASGNLLNPTALGGITIPASGSAGATAMSLNFSQITQNAGSSQVNLLSQDGFPPGQLQSFTIGNDGVITGVFSNGLTKALGQIAVGSFSNPGGLTDVGSNLLNESVASGPATIGTANTGGRGSIQSGFLEQSNVDIGTQFTNMIVTQRGYEANTKMVTTVNTMLQDLVNMVQ